MEIQSNLRRKKFQGKPQEKLHRTNQGCNFLGGSFSNRDIARASIQFRRESHNKPQATSGPSSECLVDQIQVQKPILVVAIDQMPDRI